jgi:hypothetical protein
LEADRLTDEFLSEESILAEAPPPSKIPFLQKVRNWIELFEEYSGPICFILTFAVTALIAFLNYGSKSQGALTNILLVFLGSLFQALGYSISDKAGRVDPQLADSAVRDLYNQVLTTRFVRVQSEELLKGDDLKAEREFLQQISVHLSYIEDSLSRGIKNWASFQPDVSRELKEEDQ